MILEKPFRVYPEFINGLTTVKGQMLFSKNNGMLFYINDFKTEVREIKTVSWLNKITVKRRTFLTEIDIWSWNSIGQYWGTWYEEDLPKLTYMYDFFQVRRNYVECIANAFHKLGYEITKIPKKDLPKPGEVCAKTENKS